MQAEIGKSHKHLTNYYNRSNATNEEMQTHSRQKIRTGSFVKITSSRDPNKHEIVGFKPGSDSSGNLDSYTVRAHLRKPHSKTVFTPVSSTRDVAASTIHKLNSLEESMYDPNLGKNKQTLVEKKPKKMNEVPVETMKQVKMVHREEAVDTDPNTGKKIHKKVKIHKEEIDENLKVGSMVRVTNPKATPKHKIIGVEGDKYHIEKPDGTKIHLSKERIHKINAIKEEQIDEREMTSDEKAKREKIVMALKKKMAGFKERYGERAKDVMYATATKQAMKEEDEAAPKGKTMTGEKKDGVDVKPEMINRGASGVKSTTT
jgi:hypothetical protein